MIELDFNVPPHKKLPASLHDWQRPVEWTPFLVDDMHTGIWKLQLQTQVIYCTDTKEVNLQGQDPALSL